MKFETLGKKERKILLIALEIDIKKLKCQYCKARVGYTNCGIMPSINTKLLATIICNSPLCMCEYLEEAKVKD